MNVTQLARRADTTADTVRHYTNVGVLRPSRNPENGYRQYNRDDLRRLHFALQARSLGFTLADINQLIQASESGDSPCDTTRELIEQRLSEVQQRIHDLQHLSARMQQALESWSDHPNCAGGDDRICVLIDSFEPEATRLACCDE